jgi:hypothetical protein
MVAVAKNRVAQLKGFFVGRCEGCLQRKHRRAWGTAPNEEAGEERAQEGGGGV